MARNQIIDDARNSKELVNLASALANWIEPVELTLEEIEVLLQEHYTDNPKFLIPGIIDERIKV